MDPLHLNGGNAVGLCSCIAQKLIGDTELALWSGHFVLLIVFWLVLDQVLEIWMVYPR